MAGGNISIEISGDELKAVKAFAALSESQKDLVKDLGKTGKAAEAAADKGIKAVKKELSERRKQVSMANRLVKSHETLGESYTREVNSLKTARKQGEISNKEYAKTIKRVEEKYKAEGRAAVEAEQKGSAAFQEKQLRANAGEKSVKRLIVANQTLDQQYGKIRRDIKSAFDDGRISVEQYRTSIKHTEEEQRRLTAAQKKGFGPKAVDQLASFATGFVGVGTVITGVRKTLEFFNSEKDKAMGNTNSLVEVRTKLRQISHGDFEQMEQEADELASDPEIGLTQVQARELKFTARSTGFAGKQNERFVAQADPVFPVAEGQVVAGEFRQQFAQENLGIENSFDTFLASADQSKFDITQLSPQIQTAAQGSKAINATSADVAALTAVLAGQFGESTGQRVRNVQENIFAKRHMEFKTDSGKERVEELGGLGLIEVIEKLRDDKQLRAVFVGENKQLGTSLNAAISSLKDFSLDGKKVAGVYTARASIKRAQTDEVRPLMVKLAEARDTSTQSGRIEIARRASIAAEQRNLISVEGGYSADAFDAKGEKERLNQRSRESGDPIWRQASASMGAWGGGLVGGKKSVQFGEALMRDMGTGDLRDAWSRQEKAAEQLARATERLADMQEAAARRQDENMETLIKTTAGLVPTGALSAPGVDK